MNKIASDAVYAALSTVGPTLRKLASEKDALASENQELRNRVNMLERRDRVQKLASSIHERHLEEGRTVEETEGLLMEKAASGELELYERAYQMVGQDNLLGRPGTMPTAGGDPLEREVLGEN